MKTTVAHGDAESAMVDDGVDTESITGDDGVGKSTMADEIMGRVKCMGRRL